MLENLYKELLTKVNDGNKCVMLTYLDSHSSRNGSISDKIVLTEEDIEKKSYTLNNDVYDKINLSFDTGKPQMANMEENKAILIEPFLPKPRLIIFGGGHVSKPLSEFTSRVGFSVTIVDDRPFFANTVRFPEAERVICESFEKSFDLITIRKSDYVVIVTRGHRYDGMILREVLKQDLSYVGMIGSSRKVKGIKEELLSEGYSKDRLDSICAPIGIEINSITPDEIAISIVAQLISYKNKVNITKSGEKFNFPEFDIEVTEKISEESSMPKALLTILSSKGSVPRKAGAKMVAYYDGRTVGSIGGGCSEAGVITKARDIMQDKGFLIVHVDLTGDVAEDEGMACGGTMEVLVEVF
jgi:xanthine dehydrogenase accessory factor